MNEKPVTDALLRQFLLGKVDDQERQQIETMFVTGALSNERVMAAEQHLLDEYLENSLTPADRERFLAQYGETAVQRRKLRIAKSIQDWASTTTDVTPIRPGAVSIWNRLRTHLNLKPVFVIPIAVSMVAIIVAAVWLNSRWQQRSRHLALEQELSRINTLRDNPQTTALTLVPVSLRSTEAETEIRPQAENPFIELHLIWMQKEQYPSYQATIRKVGDSESFTVANLQPDNSSAIRLRLPTRLLTDGLYQIEVSGVSATGDTGLTDEYKFQVKE
ncbi:MAG TPA: hypothetical protein VF088_19125 [Pyrinomonadaceae bacterium]